MSAMTQNENNPPAPVVNVKPALATKTKVVEDEETQLLIKTSETKFSAVSNKIKALHPYELAEIISLNIQQGDKQYLNWIKDSVK